MEMMNKGFYNRMIKSTKRLLEAEPQKQPLDPDVLIEGSTPSNLKYISKICSLENQRSTKAKVNRKSRCIHKARSITTKTLK